MCTPIVLSRVDTLVGVISWVPSTQSKCASRTSAWSSTVEYVHVAVRCAVRLLSASSDALTSSGHMAVELEWCSAVRYTAVCMASKLERPFSRGSTNSLLASPMPAAQHLDANTQRARTREKSCQSLSVASGPCSWSWTRRVVCKHHPSVQ